MRYLRDRSGPAVTVFRFALAILAAMCITIAPCIAVSYYAPWTAGQTRSCVTGVGEHPNTDLRYAWDFVGNAGTYVRAAAGGYVDTVFNGCTTQHWGSRTCSGGCTGGWGNYVIIRHSDGHYSRYAHMQHNSIRVSKGKYVPRGTILGLLGSTGYSSGPHIHFQVQPRGGTGSSGGTISISFADIGVPQSGHSYVSGNSADSDPPELTITTAPSTSPNADGWYTTGQDVCWQATDPSGIDHTKVWWNSEDPKAVSASGCWTMRQGINTFRAHSADKAGNEGTTQSRVVRLDTSAPAVGVTAPQVCPTSYSTPQVIRWNVTDAQSGVAWVKVKWDSAAETTVSVSGSKNIPLGQHSFTVHTRNNAGLETVKTVGPFCINTTPPEIDYSGPEESVWLTTPQSIAWAVTGATAVTLQWDGGTITSVPYTGTASVPEGVHVAKMVATASSGTDVDGGEYWVDLHPPVLIPGTLITPASSGSLDTISATWQFGDSVPGANQVSGLAEYEYWVGTTPGGAEVFGPLSTTDAWAWATGLQLVEGTSYYVTVRARDAAGNWSDPATSAAINASAGQNDAAALQDSGGTSATGRACSGAVLYDAMGQFAVDVSLSEMGWAEHGYWHGDAPVATVFSVGESRQYADNTRVALGTDGQLVAVTAPTSAFNQRFYVEESDRSAGIAIQYGPLGGSALQEGDMIWVKGRLITTNQERLVTDAEVFVLDHVDPALKPMAVIARSAGGSDITGMTTSLFGSPGLYNVGLLVTVVGRVEAVDELGRFFYINDGSAISDGALVGGVVSRGVRVSLEDLAVGNGITPPAAGSVVRMTGIVSVYSLGTRWYAQVRPRAQGDLLPMTE